MDVNQLFHDLEDVIIKNILEVPRRNRAMKIRADLMAAFKELKDGGKKPQHPRKG